MMHRQDKLVMANSRTEPAAAIAELRLDRSVAYEMINDFGAAAFLQVVSEYQKNMVKNLQLMRESALQPELKEQLWALQYIKNCSAQLGVDSVAQQCRQLMDTVTQTSEVGMGLSADEQQVFEMMIDNSVESLRAICADMQS